MIHMYELENDEGMYNDPKKGFPHRGKTETCSSMPTSWSQGVHPGGSFNDKLAELTM